jgi:hypothetical protein
MSNISDSEKFYVEFINEFYSWVMPNKEAIRVIRPFENKLKKLSNQQVTWFWNHLSQCKDMDLIYYFHRKIAMQVVRYVNSLQKDDLTNMVEPDYIKLMVPTPVAKR